MGENYKNIGILVRSNKEAAMIFKYLLENPPTNSNDFKIISQESITYANSDAVLWIVLLSIGYIMTLTMLVTCQKLSMKILKMKI